MDTKKKVYFRNKAEIQHIDPGCLWEHKGKMLVLVDDDQYIAVNFQKHQHEFIKVE
jgi:hypothetical protein